MWEESDSIIGLFTQTSFYSQLLGIASDTSFSFWEVIFKAPLTVNSFKLKQIYIDWEKHRSENVCRSGGAQTTSVGSPLLHNVFSGSIPQTRTPSNKDSVYLQGEHSSQPRSTGVK